MDIKVQIDKQELVFSDFKMKEKFFSFIPEEIIVKINFSSEWIGREIYYSFSTTNADFEENKLLNNEVTIPSKYYKYPGVALYFYTKDEDIKNLKYRLTTNFLKFYLGGVR